MEIRYSEQQSYEACFEAVIGGFLAAALEVEYCGGQVRLASLVENNFNAVERLDEYAALKEEAPTHIPGSKPDNWPTNGKVGSLTTALPCHWDTNFPASDDVPIFRVQMISHSHFHCRLQTTGAQPLQ